MPVDSAVVIQTGIQTLFIVLLAINALTGHHIYTCCERSLLPLSVRRFGLCLQLPRLSFLHQTSLPDPAVISEGPKPLLSASNSAAMDGNKDAKELQMQACLQAQIGHPLPSPTRVPGGAVQRCGCPLGQHEQIQCTCFTLPRVVLSIYTLLASFSS